jgi:hypothetical protein
MRRNLVVLFGILGSSKVLVVDGNGLFLPTSFHVTVNVELRLFSSHFNSFRGIALFVILIACQRLLLKSPGGWPCWL